MPVDLPTLRHKTPEHVARNPQGLVPVLEIDGDRFTQSLAILDYLDETRGLGLLPAEPAERAHVRALAHSIAVDVHPVCNVSVAAYAVELSGREEAREMWMRRFHRAGARCLRGAARAVGAGALLHGREVSLADICLMPQLYNADRWGADYSDCPRILTVKAALDAHPAFAAAHPDRHAPG